MHRIPRPLAVAVASLALWLSVPAGAAETSPDDALIEKLESTKVSVDYAPEDLVKVIDSLRTQHGINLQVAWNILDTGGVRKDKRLEIQLKDVPLTVLLDNIVREIDPTGGLALGWGVERGVVVITRQSALGKQAILRAYDIRDLIESGYAIRRFAVTPALTLETTGREWVGGEQKKEAAGGMGGGGGGAIFGDAGDSPATTTRMEKVEEIVNLIMEVVAPESWMDNGGEVGMIRPRDGVLYIRQTLQSQQRIREVLDLVRSTQPEPLNVDVAIVRLSPSRSAELRSKAGASFPVIPGDLAQQLAFGANTEGVLFRSTIGGRNGEAAWISDIVQTDVLAALTPVVGDHVAADQPTLGQVHSGLEIIALPQINPTSGDVALDVEMAWKPEIGIDQAKDANSLDRTLQRMRTVASQTRSKLGQAVALTIPATPHDGGASVENDDWVIVRVRGAEAKSP